MRLGRVGHVVFGTPGSDAAAPAGGGGPNQRYTYLVGRLRGRQITMEEATELFALMQAMIARANETARAAAAYRTPATPPPPAALAGAPAARPPAAPGSADDFLLVGLLAMGAGAGLLAALSKRIGDSPPPAAPSGSGRSNASAASR